MDDLELIEYIESKPFAVEIADIVSAAVWFFFDIHASANAYSVNDPIWILTYATDWYLTALSKAYYIYPPAVLFRKIDYDLPYNSWAVYQIGFIEIIPQVVKEHHLLPIIDYVKKHRCFEDFQENRESKYKTAFVDQWYHRRTKHPEMLISQLQGDFDEDKGQFKNELADPNSRFEEEAETIQQNTALRYPVPEVREGYDAQRSKFGWTSCFLLEKIDKRFDFCYHIDVLYCFSGGISV